MRTYTPYLIFIAGLLIGAGLGSLWTGSGPVANPFITEGEMATTTTPETPPASSGAVTVADQPAGESVTVEAITASTTPLWVAVREMGNGGLGNTLGAARVAVVSGAVTVPLLRATAPGVHYAIELYRDDAGGSFGPSTNSVYIDPETGQPAVSYFKTTP